MDKSLTNFHLQRPSALLSYSPDFRHGVGQVGGEWPIDVGLQLLEKEKKPKALKSIFTCARYLFSNYGDTEEHAALYTNQTMQNNMKGNFFFFTKF